MTKEAKDIKEAEKKFDEFKKSTQEIIDTRPASVDMTPGSNSQPMEISQKDIEKSKDIYLKPKRQVSSKEKFNERFREDYNFQSEFVNFIAEHKEIIGDDIVGLWTKPFPGMPAQEWDVPVGKPVWGPRYLAEKIHRSKYHRLKMAQNVTTGADGMGQYFGSLAVDTIVQRLDAIPVSKRKSIFMGAHAF